MRATTMGTSNFSRARRAATMFELSPLETAAKAPASSTPARRRTSSSKPYPWTVWPLKSKRSMRNAISRLSMTATVWPRASSRAASSEPTRPHPMMMTCTALSLSFLVVPPPPPPASPWVSLLRLPARTAGGRARSILRRSLAAPRPVKTLGTGYPQIGGGRGAVRFWGQYWARGGQHEISKGAEPVAIEARRTAEPTPQGPGPEPVRGPAPGKVPSHRYQSLGYRTKRTLLGPPLKTSQLITERITKKVALAVFSSDPISSTAYATEEILLVLVTAVAATRFTVPVSLAIAGLLLLLVISYRQVIEAYPSAGGAYVVSRDNFGTVVSAVAGAALLIDYILTVAVSVSAGVAAMASVFRELEPWVVELSVAFVVLLAWGNLRGIKEAGRIFAIPTYVYVTSMAGVVLLGIWRAVVGGLSPVAYQPDPSHPLFHAGEALTTVSFFLILRAFAAGTTALTGVEAISNGVSAFRRPEAKNAKTTLLTMALIMGSLFIGISYLANRFTIKPYANGFPTVVAQLADHVLGQTAAGRAAFVLVQSATLLILVLAANTSFSGFPLLASFAAGDALLPRQLRKRGHRLVYSNGIVVLSLIAIVLVIGFRARTSALIPLYAIGVVTSFTLSQAGMTVR